MDTKNEKILIVDDDPAQGKTLARVLELEGFHTAVADSGLRALETIERDTFDLMLTDLKMPGMDGMDLFRKVHVRHPELPVMIVTAHGTIESAIEAVREGVVDFIQKPVYADELMHRFQTVFREQHLRRENAQLKSQLLHRDRGDAMVGTSEPMRALREQIARVAKTEASVLVLGESGTGKELVADAIHYGSNRAHAPLIKLNCAAIPETLLEDELFGHERGAYTGAVQRRKGCFELADGGTLFLDEIGEMPLSLQVKLLRLLQESTFQRLGGSESIRADVRVICATNQDLQMRVAKGEFREDLFYRINVVPLRVPPLRMRGDDVELLAHQFAREAGARNAREIASISSAAAARLAAHQWPGNVRELRNVIERATIMGSGPTLEEFDLHIELPGAARGENGTGSGAGDGLVNRLMNSEIAFEEFERELLVRALERTRGNQTRAARMLGMTRRTLQYRIDKFDIDCEPMRR
ncbi:MAG: sigma-54-dependent transcriptional regulator [Planctomycetota bacterium]|jgi:DNA-binding NtrC family response regulator